MKKKMGLKIRNADSNESISVTNSIYYTVRKLQNFSVIQILREIKVEDQSFDFHGFLQFFES